MTATPAAPAAATEDRVCISVPIVIRGEASIFLTADEARAIAEDQIPADERKDCPDPVESGISAWLDNTLAEAVLENVYQPEYETVDVNGAADHCKVCFGEIEVECHHADLSDLWETSRSARISLAAVAES